MLISEAPSILLACLAMPAAAHLFWRVFILRRTPLLTESSSFISTPVMCTAPSLPLQRPPFGVTLQSDHLTCNLVDTCQTRENTQSVLVASQQSLECVETIAGLDFAFLGLVSFLILILRMSWLYPFINIKATLFLTHPGKVLMWLWILFFKHSFFFFSFSTFKILQITFANVRRVRQVRQQTLKCRVLLICTVMTSKPKGNKKDSIVDGLSLCIIESVIFKKKVRAKHYFPVDFRVPCILMFQKLYLL